MSSLYVIADWRLLATLNAAGSLGDTGYVPAIASWAGDRPERFFESYIQQVPNAPPREYYLFYPEYFRTLAVRLALFGGEAVHAENIVVVTYTNGTAPDGTPAKNLVDGRQFKSEDEAARFAAEAPAGTQRRIVSTDPYQSCVSIPASSEFHLLWKSQEQLRLEGDRGTNGIRIFEVAP
jgi:hypothetical protein